MTSVGSGHLCQACFRRRPWIPCGGWICGGRERPEAGGPVARVQERTDKARAVGTVDWVPGNTKEAAKAEGEGRAGVCSDILSAWVTGRLW